MCVFNTAKDFLAPVVGCKLVCCKFIRHHLIDSALDVIKEKEGVPGYMSLGTPSLGSYVVLSLFFYLSALSSALLSLPSALLSLSSSALSSKSVMPAAMRMLYHCNSFLMSLLCTRSLSKSGTTLAK